jgi:hypothetical protein
MVRVLDLAPLWKHEFGADSNIEMDHDPRVTLFEQRQPNGTTPASGQGGLESSHFYDVSHDNRSYVASHPCVITRWM